MVDTNVWSELTKPRPAPNVLAWLRRNEPELILSTLVIAEIRYGIEMTDHPAKQASLTAWLTALEQHHATRLLPFDTSSGYAYAKLAANPEMKKREPQIFDVQIAAQAIAHDMSVATRNAKDFEWTGVRLLDPWTA